jgi:hypothetical protein
MNKIRLSSRRPWVSYLWVFFLGLALLGNLYVLWDAFHGIILTGPPYVLLCLSLVCYNLGVLVFGVSTIIYGRHCSRDA